MQIPEGFFDFSEPDDGFLPQQEDAPATAAEALSRYWGYDAFRPLQAEIIDSVLNGRDTVGLLPTGGGKSITFQVPATMLPGVTLVITPLISLMKDQIDRLRKIGIDAGCLHSGMGRRESRTICELASQNKLKLLYVAPERLANSTFVSYMRSWEPSLLVVDEAHCISQWGYDFRPSYLRIGDMRTYLPDTPILALTASATPQVLDDIERQLHMRRPQRFCLSFRRDNISFNVVRTEEKEPRLLSVLDRTCGSAIVYVRSRKRCQSLAAVIGSHGIGATYYHAGMDPDSKTRAQNDWMSGRARVIVATTAFGMGIDKPDVRLVVHYDMPSTFEEYYQEAGRAGRDGRQAYAVLLASTPDKGLFARRLGQAFPQKDAILHIYDEVCRYLDIPMGGGYEQLYEFHPEAMCMRFNIDPHLLLASLKILTRSGYMHYIEETATPSRLKFSVRPSQLYATTLDATAEAVVDDILRHYPGSFTDYVVVSEHTISGRCSMDANTVYQTLLRLRRDHLLNFVPRNRTPYIFMPTRRIESRHIVIPREVYELRRDVMAAQLKAMRDYAYDSVSCRVLRMLEYFGEKEGIPCGSCDICRATRRKGYSGGDGLPEKLMRLVGAQPGRRMLLSEVRRQWPVSADELADTVRRMVDSGDLVYDPPFVALPEGC